MLVHGSEEATEDVTRAGAAEVVDEFEGIVERAALLNAVRKGADMARGRL